MRKPRIALAQIRYSDKNNNLEKIKKYIRLAKKANADIVCFAEICITKKETLHFNHVLLKEIKNECRKYSIWCIVSDEFKIGKKEYNIAIWIDRQGKIKGHYKKINIYGDEL